MTSPAPLPAPVEITRDELSGESFNAMTFLTAHSDFQSLVDLRSKVQKWEQRLVDELKETVNDNYHDFVAIQTTLAESAAHLDTIKLEVLKLQTTVAKEAGLLSDISQRLAKEIRVQRELDQAEAEVGLLLGFLDDLQTLETHLDQLERPRGKSDQLKDNVSVLVMLTKTWVSVVSIAKEKDDYASVEVVSKRVHGIKPRLLKAINDSMAQTKDSDSLFELAKAKGWVIQTIHEYNEYKPS